SPWRTRPRWARPTPASYPTGNVSYPYRLGDPPPPTGRPGGLYGNSPATQPVIVCHSRVAPSEYAGAAPVNSSVTATATTTVTASSNRTSPILRRRWRTATALPSMTFVPSFSRITTVDGFDPDRPLSRNSLSVAWYPTVTAGAALCVSLSSSARSSGLPDGGKVTAPIPSSSTRSIP